MKSRSPPALAATHAAPSWPEFYLRLRNIEKLFMLKPPRTLEGGDVLRIGRDLFIGITSRTNLEGIEFVRKHAAPHGYNVQGS